MISYRGVYLTLDTQHVCNDVENTLSLESIFPDWNDEPQDHVPVNLLRRRPMPKPKLNTLYWPSGASRFTYGCFLANYDQLKAIYADGPGVIAPNLPGEIPASGQAVVGELALWNFENEANPLTQQMHLLPPTPIYNIRDEKAGDSEPLFLLVLVDDRYFWRDILVDVSGLNAHEDWNDLFQLAFDALGYSDDLDLYVPLALQASSPMVADGLAFKTPSGLLNAGLMLDLIFSNFVCDCDYDSRQKILAFAGSAVLPLGTPTLVGDETGAVNLGAHVQEKVFSRGFANAIPGSFLFHIPLRSFGTGVRHDSEDEFYKKTIEISETNVVMNFDPADASDHRMDLFYSSALNVDLAGDQDADVREALDAHCLLMAESIVENFRVYTRVASPKISSTTFNACDLQTYVHRHDGCYALAESKPWSPMIRSFNHRHPDDGMPETGPLSPFQFATLDEDLLTTGGAQATLLGTSNATITVFSRLGNLASGKKVGVQYIPEEKTWYAVAGEC